MYVKSKSGRVFRLPSAAEDAGICGGIAADPDTCELSDEQLQHLRPVGRPKSEMTKQPISIRLSPDVVTFFKSSGAGWQTRINEALQDWIKTHPSR